MPLAWSPLALKLIGNPVSLFCMGHLMLAVDQPSFPAVENKLTAFLKSKLHGLNLETMATMDNRVSLHCQAG